MKTLKCNAKRNLMALMVGAMILPSMGLAQEAAPAPAASGIEPKEGVSLAELGNRVRDLNIRLDGRKLILTGTLPARCAQGARVDYNQGAGDLHVLTIRLHESCEKADFKAEAREPRVSLSGALGSINLADVAGKVVLRSFKEGDSESKRNQDDPIVATGARQQLSVESTASVAAAEEALARQALVEQLKDHCLKGNVVGVSSLAEEAARLGLNITAAVETSRSNQLQLIKNRLAKARNAAQARTVFDEFQAAAERGENGLEAEALISAYVNKRFSLLRARVEEVKSDADVKPADIMAEIAELRNELNEMNSENDLFKARRADLADLYAKLGDGIHARAEKESNGKKKLEMYEQAANAFDKGRDLDKEKNSRAWNNAIAKSLLDAADACADMNPDPRRSAKCEVYEKRAKAFADRTKKEYEALAKRGDDEAAAEAEDFLMEYNRNFGGGPAMYQMGFGWMHPYSPSRLEQRRSQNYQSWMTEQQQKMMEKMYGSYFGGMMGGMGGMGGMNMMGMRGI